LSHWIYSGYPFVSHVLYSISETSLPVIENPAWIKGERFDAGSIDVSILSFLPKPTES